MRRRPVTPEAGGKVDPTQIGRALAQVGIELIPVYSPKPAAARSGCSQTLHDRLPKELRLVGITSMDAANRFLADDYLPRHNAFLPRPPEDAASAFAPFAGPHEDILCVPEEHPSATTTWAQEPCPADRPTASVTTTSSRRHSG